MTISRAKPAGWLTGDKLTAADQNQVDINTTYGLDKRSGQTDTLQSVVTSTGAGRIVESYTAGANANTTYLVSGGNSLIDASSLTANRTYTFSNTNAQAGDRIFVLNRSSFYLTLNNAAATTLIVLGSEIYNNGESGWAEVMYTGSAWVLARSALRPALTSQEFTANGTWTCPRGVTLALVIGWGGGGAGGGGAAGVTVAAASPTLYYALGGGGGGGAQRHTMLVQVTPGSAYSVTIGAGGGSVGAGVNGSHGGDTSFSSIVFSGGQGGSFGTAYNGSGSNIAARGGGPTKLASSASRGNAVPFTGTDLSHLVIVAPGGGGASTISTALPGTGSGPGGFAGGDGGNNGTTAAGTPSYGYQGGAGGGGGGGGGGSVGANGGAGGNGVSTTGLAGANGSNAAANSGGGGGGGGGGGCAGTTPGAGGGGGAGGSGMLIVVPMR